jgi:hypothetical protein
LIRPSRSFELPINGGNDGIDGTFPYSLDILSKTFHLQNLDVGNIKRSQRRFRNGIPPRNVKRIVFLDDMPKAMRPANGDTKLEQQLKKIGQVRWLYLQLLQYVADETR